MTARAPRRSLAPWLLLCLGAVVGLLVAVPASARQPVRVERTVFLMGTLATLVAEALDRDAAVAQLERMVRVVERTEAALSTWREDSVLGALNRWPVGEPFPLPEATCGLFARLAEWRAATDGAFDPAVGRLIDVRDLRGEGRIPGDDALADALAVSGFGQLAFHREACAVTRRAEVTLDAGAFGKGEALDRVREAERDRPGAWLIDFGGQLAVSGAAADGPWTVGVAHPAERGTSVLDLPLAAGSIATSGGSERDLILADGRRVGHILDPRTGRPVSRSASVTVWHEDAFAADVLSTALYVMGPDAGIAWAAARGVAACFLSADGEAGEVGEEDGAIDHRGSGADAADGETGEIGRVTFRATPAFEARFPLPDAGGGNRQAAVAAAGARRNAGRVP